MGEKKKILLVDDDEGAKKLAEFLLKQEGFDVCIGFDGVSGLEELHKEIPDLVLLDLHMPRMDGFEFVKLVRKDPVYSNLPIIMLTGSAEEESLIEAMEIGCDDYLLKPFKKVELLARVKGIIERTSRVLAANPLTKMPGNTNIVQEIESRINSGSAFSVLYVDIDKFKSFNDRYGFVKGDEVLKLTAGIIIHVIRDKDEVFAGHIGGDDFVVVAAPEEVEDICAGIIEKFDGSISGLYAEEDRSKGFIISKDRNGNEGRFPIMTISIGVVTSRDNRITHPSEVSTIGAELKKQAKAIEGSSFKID